MRLSDKSKSAFQYAPVAVAGMTVLIAYSSWGRPIWIDEFLHFAFGSMSPIEALGAISASGGAGVNHGQTGLLFFVNAVLLNLTGASLLALRLPSLVAAAIMVWSAVIFMRSRGFGWGWQLILMLAFAANSTLMYFAGEARPYMILASTSVAALAYYTTRAQGARGWAWLLLGSYAVVIGAANHPYFLLVLILVMLFAVGLGFVNGQGGGQVERSWSHIRTVANLPLLGVGAIVYVAIGAATWMRGTPSFDLDPFQYQSSPYGAARTLGYTHLASMGSLPEFKHALLLLVVLAAASVYGRSSLTRLLPPIILIGIGLVTSVAVSLISISRSYWVLQRQWTAGQALAVVGVVWLIAELYRMGGLRSSVFLRFAAMLATTYMVVAGANEVVNQVSVLRSYETSWADLEAQDLDAGRLAGDATTNDDWVKAANVNILQGGPVHPNFARYYGVEVGE